jgi:hypothetical protein
VKRAHSSLPRSGLVQYMFCDIDCFCDATHGQSSMGPTSAMGQTRTSWSPLVMSAIPPIAEVPVRARHVRVVPLGDMNPFNRAARQRAPSAPAGRRYPLSALS